MARSVSLNLMMELIFKNCQLVYASELENFDELAKSLTGTAMTVIGGN